jgi:hypothetical protein
MDGCRFEEVHADFVKVGNGTEDVAGNMALVVELFETAPDVDILAFGGKGFLGLGICIAVYPLLYVD